MLRRTALWLVACLSLTACGGDESSGTNGKGDKCNYPVGEIAYTEQSQLGYAPAEVLDPLRGGHTCTWSWNDVSDHDTAPASLQPSPAELGAELTLNNGAAPITYTQDQRPGDGNGAFSGCANAAASAPVQLRIVTADGVVDRPFNVTLGLYLDKAVEGESQIEASQLNGYSFSWDDSSWEDKGLWLLIHTDSGTLAGSLVQRASKQSSTSTEAATLANVASFSCE